MSSLQPLVRTPKEIEEERRQAFNRRTGMNREERRRMIKRWKVDKTLEVCPACGYRTPRKQTEEGIIYCALCKYILKRPEETTSANADKPETQTEAKAEEGEA